MSPVDFAKWCLLGACLWSSLLAAPARAEIPPSWLGQRIEAIEIVGEAEGRVEPRDVGVPVGVPLTRTLIRNAVLGLAETGLYRDVQIDARRTTRGITLQVRLLPRVVAMRVDVVGNAQLEDRELLRALGIQEGDEIEQDGLLPAAERIEQRYAEIGYREADARLLLRETDDPTQRVLRVEIDEGEPTTIERYVFDGDRLPRRKGLRRTLALNLGERLDLEQLGQTLEGLERRLREAGYYEASFGEPRVEVRDRRAVVHVPSRVGPHYRIQIKGHEPLTRGEVLETLEITDTALLPEGPFGALEARVVESYRKLGYVDADVEVFTVPPPDDEPESEATLRVRVLPGPQLDVRKVRFVGARHFSQQFLREQLFSYLEEDLPGSVISQPVDPYAADTLGYGGAKDGRQREEPPPPVADPRRLFYAPTYEEALDHIRDLYRDDGFLTVEISEVDLRPIPDTEHDAEALIAIEEGPRTYTFDVRVEGNVQVTTYDLLSALALQTGEPFSYLKLEEARLRALEAYRERGFFYAKVEPAVRFSEDGTRAEIVFEIVERFIVRVGGIEIRGADRSKKSMILNRLELAPGDVYRPSKARLSEEQLLSLDVFSSVSISPEEADLPARVKTIVVSITERRSQWLGWNGGFSTGEGVRGGIEYGYRNMFGAAVRTSIRGQIGYQIVFLDEEIERNYAPLGPSERIEYQVNAGIATPYIPNAPRIGASLDFVVMQDLQRDYRMQKEGMIASLYYRPVKRLVLTFAEELEESFFQLFNQRDDDIRNLPVTELVPDGENTLLSSHISVAWDLRDRAFNPRKGALFSLSSQWAKTLRDEQRTVSRGMGNAETVTFKSNMLRFAASGAFYIPLGDKLVFASQVRWGRVVHLEKGSDSYPNRRFYLGGINFRGWRQNEMVPQDLQDDPQFDSSTVISRGGETFIAAQNELRFPLFGQVYGGVFTDIGNLWADPRALDLRELEVTVGVGIRLQTPVAALAFDYGVRQIELGPFELKGAFQFAFQRF